MSDDMDLTNKSANDWVYQRLAVLPTSIRSEDPVVALLHFRSYERAAKRRRQRRRAAVLVVLLALVVTWTVPATRGVARQLWDRFYMKSPEAVRSTMPLSEPPLFIDRIASPGTPAKFVADVGEAQQ